MIVMRNVENGVFGEIKVVSFKVFSFGLDIG